MRFPSLKSWLIFGAGFVSCIVCLIALIFGAWFFWLKPLQEKMLAQMSLSPPDFFTPHPADFSLSAVGADGRPFHFQDYRGRVVVLNFWATWCGPCMAELPTMGRLAAHYSADKDMAVVCISREPAAVVFKNSQAVQSGAPLYALTGQLPKVYETEAIPATFVIGRDGLIVAQHIGSADWSAPSVINLIDSLRQRPDTAPKSATVIP